MKPSKCVEHQNWKYIRFCPMCLRDKKLADAESELSRYRECVKVMRGALGFYGDKNQYESVCYEPEDNVGWDGDIFHKLEIDDVDIDGEHQCFAGSKAREALLEADRILKGGSE